MTVIKFGKWNSSATSLFIYDRISWKGYKPLPLCKVKWRYVGQ